MITLAQKQRLLEAMAPYMALDKYGRATIRNIYFDTPTYQLIRRSIEKPHYKEKLRIRCYREIHAGSPVFVELKKKYNGVVYKRRLSMEEQSAMDWIAGHLPPPAGQIGAEIEYFRNFYTGLRPSVFLSYEREAFYCKDGGDFRVTFDDTILCRQEALSLEEPIWGTPILPDGYVLMEIKTGGGVPLWMTHFLTQERIYKTSYSKYGMAYQTMILPQLQGGYLHA
jgi:hypothetical protein